MGSNRLTLRTQHQVLQGISLMSTWLRLSMLSCLPWSVSSVECPPEIHTTRVDK